MKLNLACEGMSVEEHASVAICIRHVCPEAALSEVDTRSARHMSPEMIGALGTVVSATAAVVALVLQALSLRKDNRPPTRDDIHISIVKVEVTLKQEIGPAMKERIYDELQKLPAPITLHLGSPNKEYLLHVRSSDDVHTIDGHWSHTED